MHVTNTVVSEEGFNEQKSSTEKPLGRALANSKSIDSIRYPLTQSPVFLLLEVGNFTSYPGESRCISYVRATRDRL